MVWRISRLITCIARMLKLLLHGKKKKERKDEIPLAPTTQDTLLKGFRQKKVLGTGCFGAVWSFVPGEEKQEKALADPRDYKTLLPDMINKLIQASSPTTNPKFIIKVSVLGVNKRFLDSFVREVYFLQLLRETGYVPSLIHHAEITIEENPVTATAAATATQSKPISERRGLQVMERFEGNVCELGNLQAKQIGLSSSENVVAFTWHQIRQMAFLALRLDELGISHGDFKLTNLLYRLRIPNDKTHVVPLAEKLLYKEPEYDLRVADFGFAGFVKPNALVPFAPLIGFWGNLGCSTKRKSTQKEGEPMQFFLDEAIPDRLYSHINRLQLYVMLLEMKYSHVANLETKTWTKLHQPDLAELLNVQENHLQLLSIYLPRIRRCLSKASKQFQRAWRKKK